MQCSNCGFRMDPLNESQPVCPVCGSGPGSSEPDDFERMEWKELEGLTDLGESLENEPDEMEEVEATGPRFWVQ